MSVGAAEPISPELVLVSPELRTLAVGAMWEASDDAFGPAGRRPESAVLDPPDGFRRFLLYAAWQALVGALIGIAAFAAFAALVVALALIER